MGKSGEKWWKVVKSDEKWGKVIKSGMEKNGEKWLKVVQVAKGGKILENLGKVEKSGTSGE